MTIEETREEIDLLSKRIEILEWHREQAWKRLLDEFDPREPVTGLTARQIMDKYHCTEPTANRIRKRGWAQTERKRA